MSQEEQLELFKDVMPHRETKWAVLQARILPEEKKEIWMFCKSNGVTYSLMTRLIWKKVIANHRAWPRFQHTDVTKEIDEATEQVTKYLPVVLQQRRYNPRMY